MKLEDAPNGEVVRNRIGTEHTSLIFIAVKAIEAWFLADSAALHPGYGLNYSALGKDEA
jgi:hypothetical protein